MYTSKIIKAPSMILINERVSTHIPMASVTEDNELEINSERMNTGYYAIG